MKCPDCGHENRAGVLLCEKCNTSLYESLLEQVATKQLSQRQAHSLGFGDAASPTSNPLVVYVTSHAKPFTIERRFEVVLGRQDPQNPNARIDVDLGEYGAENLGVSRRHLSIKAANNPPLISDLGSANGTYINGQQLTPNREYLLNSGDEVRLGRFVMRFYYK